MGGNAFPEFNTIRLNATDYNIMVTKCINLLFSQFTYPKNRFRIIESYRNKDSFGDLDILWCGNEISPDDICNALGAICYKQNKSVVSYAMPIDNNVFQVDLINVDEKHLMSAYSYFAFNDLGNLLGRIFHRAGFKLGHKGMLYVVREPDNYSHVIDEIEVTSSWKEALEFAGYDYNVWLKGFDDLEDMFRFVVSSPYFDKKIFSLEPIEDGKE